MDGTAQKSFGQHEGTSGERRGKDTRITLGDLSLCRQRLPWWRHRGKEREKSAEAIVAKVGGCQAIDEAKGRIS